MDWTHIFVALLASLPALVAALATFVQSLRNGSKANSQLVEIRELHILVNDRVTQLLETTREHALLEGVSTERERVAAAVAPPIQEG